jgi:hypothetical protein
MLQVGMSPVRVPDEVDIFNLPNPSSPTMALGSTQPLTEMSARNLPGGKSGRGVGLTTLPQSVSRMSQNVGDSTSRKPKGLHCLYRDTFTLPFNLFLNSGISQRAGYLGSHQRLLRAPIFPTVHHSKFRNCL